MPILSLIGCSPSDSDTSISTVIMILFLFLGGLIILVLVMSLVWLLTRKSKGESPGQQKDDRYLEIAKERYAKGEISKDEFEQLKKIYPKNTLYTYISN